MPGVDAVPARADQRPALEAMFQLYVHDFSAFWAGRPDGELGEDGRFAPYEHLDSYWRAPDRRPLLIRADGRLAGFALINAHSHMRRPVEHAVAEFFVARKHRRAGVGAAAAWAISPPSPEPGRRPSPAPTPAPSPLGDEGSKCIRRRDT